MKHLELPPVIVALDVSAPTLAHDIITAINDYDRNDIALQFRASRLLAEGDALVQEAKEADWNVIIATRFGDEPKKLALDLDTYISDSANNPFAITLEPPARTSGDAEVLEIALSRVHGLGVVTIGFSRLDKLFSNDHDHIADTDYGTWRRARELGIRATEVAFSGMRSFYNSIASYEGTVEDGPLIVVSKILDSDSIKDPRNPDTDMVHSNARQVYESGAASVLMGDSVIRANKPTDVLDAVLEAHRETR